jgi:small subunit ribosomal protein S6
MRNYELIFIVHPDLEESAYQEVCDRVKKWIGDLGGTITKENNWGTRRLAYSIRKQREGQYMLFDMQFDPAKIAELERNLQIVEPIMRYMTVKLDD